MNQLQTVLDALECAQEQTDSAELQYAYGVALSIVKQMMQAEPVGEVSGKYWGSAILYKDMEPGSPLFAAPQAVPAVTDEMVSRFLCWPFPHDFYPDGGISFARFTGPADMRYEFKPIGTNLLNADQARTMLEHVFAAAPKD